MKLALRLEGGQFFSQTARLIMHQRYGVKIGAYSYGACFTPGAMPPRTEVGRYVSIAEGVVVLIRNHPLNRRSTHPFFFNSKLKVIPQDNMAFSSLFIDHDAWIGANVIFTPKCNRVGIGAVVGAGSVVTEDVPDFAIVAGNPARLIRYRFSEKTQAQMLDEKWWNSSVTDCAGAIDRFTTPLSDN
jgi:virginiamycin A acetyltransferase